MSRTHNKTKNEVYSKQRFSYGNVQSLLETQVNAADNFIFNSLPKDWKYELVIVQQPDRARACGYGNKDVRPINPAVFLKMNVYDSNGLVDIEIFSSKTNHELIIVAVDNYDKNSSDEKMVNLVGNQVSNSHKVKDLNEERGIYFVFSNLSVRSIGDFYLSFSLFYIGKDLFQIKDNPSCKRLAYVDSKKFTVYSSKDFPGIIEMSKLAQSFAAQGVPIRLRNHKNIKDLKGSTSTKSKTNVENS
ncbi:11587_t:CDS:2 [Entrophospora sp. SA101]|nr:762_t:CDS:2 [Entrophospora sp. SA101]CAJ0626234.1 11253_t:CDS:2 [Entrophospora sp. SA101]CAJ0760559.1 11587_t:CDS:2 [Entrophospora sp. SA101]CAJ0825502.1 4973_t:CDS:2 [Entrophospora sp. SA101]CAJ0827979.1 3683_t:CDS:2 [Entrophospora sp. SA101]